MCITTNQTKIKNKKQQNYHNLRTQASLEDCKFISLFTHNFNFFVQIKNQHRQGSIKNQLNKTKSQ